MQIPMHLSIFELNNDRVPISLISNNKPNYRIAKQLERIAQQSIRKNTWHTDKRR